MNRNSKDIGYIYGWNDPRKMSPDELLNYYIRNSCTTFENAVSAVAATEKEKDKVINGVGNE